MRGVRIPVHVTAYPDRVYTGTVARIAHALDPKTRTMPVELDVLNRDGTLAPGMYPSVKRPVRREHPAVFVPKTSVVTTTGTYLRHSLEGGDKVVRRGTDELRDGMPIGVK